MTTKVRITNIVDDTAHSNGDVLVKNPRSGDRVLFPGDTYEEWMVHGEPIEITERWPSQKPPEPK